MLLFLLNRSTIRHNKNKRQLFAIKLVALIPIFVQSGCATLSNSIETDYGDTGTMIDLPYVVSNKDTPTPGSLYNHRSPMTLFEDRRAYREGDILTVNLEEQMKSSRKFNTTIDKNDKIKVPDPTIFGALGTEILSKLGISLEQIDKSQRNFKGTSSNGQQNQLTGKITVIVRQVLDNGSLFVRGKKQVRIGHGDETVFISGLVRPEDISPDNQISSLRLADAKISYTGKGDAAESNVMGWLSRFFNSRWYPF